MDKLMENRFKIYTSMFFDWLTFTLTFYMTASFILSFAHSPLFIVFNTLNIALISLFTKVSHKSYGKKRGNILILITVLTLAALIYFLGYFNVSQTLIKL